MQNRYNEKNEKSVSYQEKKYESFESLVDFFTLLSFAFILISIFYGVIRSAENGGSTFKFSDATLKNNSQIAQVPDNLAILILTEYNGEDFLHLIQTGGSQEYNLTNIRLELISTYLDSFLKPKLKNNKIHLVIDETVNYNPQILIKLEKWFAKYDFDVNIQFYNKK